MRFLNPIFTLVLALALIAPAGNSAAAPALPAAVSSTLYGCGYTSQVDALLAQTTQADWSGWVRRLSGAEEVQVGGKQVTIQTRYSQALFDGTSPAYDYVRETITGWYQGTAAQIEEDSFPYYTQTFKNLVLTIPGSAAPGEIVILSAHLDSTSSTPLTSAPGADDNASGAAALLEAARILRGQSLPRTLRLIWFTGEEQGLRGSYAYTADHSLAGVVGVVNVDMIGYDGNNDRCFELHVGTLAASDRVGQCFARANEVYHLGLRFDYLTTTATTRSDHAAFWSQGTGAVEVLENYFNDQQSTGCTGSDPSPYYHSTLDTFANMTPAYSFEVARGALATAFSLADPVPLQMLYLPILLKN